MAAIEGEREKLGRRADKEKHRWEIQRRKLAAELERAGK
jgi:hypothetical protein